MASQSESNDPFGLSIQESKLNAKKKLSIVNSPSTLLSLPPELHLEIVSYLDCDSIQKLRLVHRRLASNISVPTHIHNLPRDNNKYGFPYSEKLGQRPCTIACLLGLINSAPMDRNCPNFARHTRHHLPCNFPYHPISQERLLVGLYEALKMGSFDAKGNRVDDRGKELFSIFSVAECMFGYAVVGKGTSCNGSHEVYPAALEQQGIAFQQVRDLQGQFVPVIIGYISVPKVPGLEELECMLLYSWTGYPLSRPWTEQAARHVEDAFFEITRRGVSDHVELNDIRTNPETRLVVLAYENCKGPFILRNLKNTMSKYHTFDGSDLPRTSLSTSNTDASDLKFGTYFDP